MGQSSRLWLSISGLAIWLVLVLSLTKPAFAPDNQVVFIFGGDVEWSLNARPPTVRYRVADPTPYGQIVYGRRDVRDVRDQVTGDWPPIPYVDQGESGAFLKNLGLKGPSDASKAESLSYPLLEHEEYTKDYSTDDALLNYPLQRLAPIFQGADLVMVNCEGALSDHGRPRSIWDSRTRGCQTASGLPVKEDRGVVEPDAQRAPELLRRFWKQPKHVVVIQSGATVLSQLAPQTQSTRVNGISSPDL